MKICCLMVQKIQQNTILKNPPYMENAKDKVQKIQQNTILKNEWSWLH